MGPHPPPLFVQVHILREIASWCWDCRSWESQGRARRNQYIQLVRALYNGLPENGRTRISAKLRVSKLRLADRSAATRKRSELANRSRKDREHTRTALPQVPGSIKHSSIPLSKLQPLVTKLYSEERIIRTGVKSFPKKRRSRPRRSVSLHKTCSNEWDALPRRWNRSCPSCRKLSSLTKDRKRTGRASYWQMAVAKRVECRTQVLQNESRRSGTEASAATLAG